MEESNAEISTERAEAELLPEELFYRALGRNPENELMWANLQQYLSNCRNVDGGKSVEHSVKVDEIFSSFFLFSRGAEKVSDLKPEDQKQFYRGRLTARLHDLGKGVKENGEFKYGKFLNSFEKLNEDQMKAMYSHAEDGARMLEELGMPADIIDAVRDHNKTEDGVLKDEITQMIVIADILEALTSKKRPYRGPAPKDAAYDYVKRKVLIRLADETLRREAPDKAYKIVNSGEGTVKEMYLKWKPAYTGVQDFVNAA